MATYRPIRPGYFEFCIELGYNSLGKRLRKYRTLPCKGEREAKKIAARLEVEFSDENYIDNDNIKFGTLYENWKKEYAPATLDPLTQEGYEYVFEAHILPQFKKATVKDIKARDIIRFLDEGIKRGDGQYGIERRHRCIRSIFKYAVKYDYISKDVSLEVPKPKIRARKKEVYDSEEIAHIFDLLEKNNVNKRQKLMITLALTGGLRRGEVMGIDMDEDIDFENNCIYISRSVQYTKRHGLRIKSTKNEEERSVTFDEITMKEIYEYRRERKKEIMKIRDEYKGYKDVNGKVVNLLFAHIDGTPYAPHTVSQFWRRIVKRYELKKISFHDLRHSSATYLLSKGFNMKAIQERLGHKDYKTTMNTYAHVTKKMEKDTGNAFLDVRAHKS
jgi:integrase